MNKLYIKNLIRKFKAEKHEEQRQIYLAELRLNDYWRKEREK